MSTLSKWIDPYKVFNVVKGYNVCNPKASFFVITFSNLRKFGSLILANNIILTFCVVIGMQ